MSLSAPAKTPRPAQPFRGSVLTGAYAGPQRDDEEARFRPISWALTWRLLRLLKPHWKLYLLSAACAIGAIGLELSTPVFVQRMIDGAIPSGNVNAIWSEAGMWAAVMLASLTLSTIEINYSSRCGERVVNDLRLTVFAHLQRLSMSFYDKTKLGRIITRGTSDMDALRGTVISGVNTVAINVILMAGATGMLLWLDWRLFLALAGLGPLLSLTNMSFRKRVGRQHQVARASWSRVASNMAENITGVRVVSAFNRQDENLTRFNELQEENTYNNVRTAHLTGMYQPLLDFLGFLGDAILLGYGGACVLALVTHQTRMPGDLTVGEVVAARSYWMFFRRPTISMGEFYNTLMRTMASAERIFQLLDLKPEITDRPAAQPLPRLEGHIVFEHVTFGYDPARPVLHDLCLDMPAGKTFALVGATGSGKSSTVSLLARFYEFQQGRILLDGRDLRSATMESLHRQMGLVLQNNYLFSGTILDNIRYPRPDATDAEVYSAAQGLGVHDIFAALPQGYHTPVGERGASVSMGLRQLICFTRILLANPRIFLLDEATSSIDTVTEMEVQAALEKLVRGRTTVIVAHRLSTIVKADRIVVLEAGRIIERGTHPELLAANGHYAMLYRNFTAHEGPRRRVKGQSGRWKKPGPNA